MHFGHWNWRVVGRCHVNFGFCRKFVHNLIYSINGWLSVCGNISRLLYFCFLSVGLHLYFELPSLASSQKFLQSSTIFLILGNLNSPAWNYLKSILSFLFRNFWTQDGVVHQVIFFIFLLFVFSLFICFWKNLKPLLLKTQCFWWPIQDSFR